MYCFINRKRNKIIRQNPIYDITFIVLEQLSDEQELKEEIDSAPKGYSLRQAFAYFCNEGLIKHNEWERVKLHNNLKQTFDYDFS